VAEPNDPFGDTFTFDYPILGGWWFGALDPGAGIYYDPGPPPPPPPDPTPAFTYPLIPNPQVGVETLPPVYEPGPAPLPNPFGTYADELPVYDYTGQPSPQFPAPAPSELYDDVILGQPIEAPTAPRQSPTPATPPYVPRLQPIRRARSPRRRTGEESATGIAASALGTSWPPRVLSRRPPSASNRVGSSSLPFNRIPRDPLDELGGATGVGSIPKRRPLPRIPRRPRRTRPAPDRTPRRPRRIAPIPVPPLFPFPRRRIEPFPRIPPQPIRTLPTDPPRRIDLPRPPAVDVPRAPVPSSPPGGPGSFPLPKIGIPTPVPVPPQIPIPGPKIGPVKSPRRRLLPLPRTLPWPFSPSRRAQPSPLPRLVPDTSPIPQPRPAIEPLPFLGDPIRATPPPEPLTRLNIDPLPFLDPQPDDDACRECEEDRDRRRRPSNVVAAIKSFRRRMSQNSLDNLRSGNNANPLT
jgi:hypothetical protein